MRKGRRALPSARKKRRWASAPSATRELVFEKLVIPETNIIGKPGLGFLLAVRLFDRFRPGIGAQAVGLAQDGLEAATDYAVQRIQFDQPIITQPVVQQMLADMDIQTEAARALVYAAARLWTAALESVNRFVRHGQGLRFRRRDESDGGRGAVCGGSGYMRDYPVEKMMRDAKILQIYEGTEAGYCGAPSR